MVFIIIFSPSWLFCKCSLWCSLLCSCFLICFPSPCRNVQCHLTSLVGMHSTSPLPLPPTHLPQHFAKPKQNLIAMHGHSCCLHFPSCYLAYVLLLCIKGDAKVFAQIGIPIGKIRNKTFHSVILGTSNNPQ